MKNFTSNTQKTGLLGEDIACRYLKMHDFNILERNYTRKWGEIDIIATKNEILHFFEVKSRQVGYSFFEDNNKFFTEEKIRPEESMHAWKMMRLRRVVETYLINERIGNTDWHFDLLLVFIDTKTRRARVKVVENIIL
jgi:putative endonuclease